MGQPKQLVKLAGEALVRRAARVALEAGLEPVIVVLGCRADAVIAACPGLEVQMVLNDRWSDGMASSIRAGVTAVPQEASAVVLLACDQPAVDAAFLTAMLQAHHTEPGRLITASYAGAVGIPALFPRRCFESLQELTGDRGARSLLVEADMVKLPLPGGEMDIDTPQDLDELRRRLSPT